MLSAVGDNTIAFTTSSAGAATLATNFPTAPSQSQIQATAIADTLNLKNPFPSAAFGPSPNSSGIPLAPTNLHILNFPPPSNSVYFGWTASTSPNIQFYTVYRNTVNNVFSATYIGANTVTNFFDTTVAASTTYYYWVDTINTSNAQSLPSHTGTNPSPADGMPATTATPVNPGPLAVGGPNYMIGTFQQPDFYTPTWKGRGVNTLFDATGDARFGQSTDFMNAYPNWLQAAQTNGLYMVAPQRSSAYPNMAVDPVIQPYLDNVIGWYQPDEPDLLDTANGVAQVPLSTYTTNYANWHSSKPVYTTFSGGNVRKPASFPASLYSGYSAKSDWIGNDFYPVTGFESERGTPPFPYANGYWLDLNNPADAIGRPTDGTILQTLASPTYSNNSNQYAVIETSNQSFLHADTGVSPGQLKGEIWDAVIRGAKGVVYFAAKPPPGAAIYGPQYDATQNSFDSTPPDVSIEMIAQNARLAALGSVLSQTPTAGFYGDGVAQTDLSMLQGSERIYNGQHYYLVENRSSRNIGSVSFPLAGETGSATVWGEGRAINGSAGTFTDASGFAPWSTHVYVIPLSTAKPATPFNVVAKALSTTQVKLTWSDPLSTAISYNVYRAPFSTVTGKYLLTGNYTWIGTANTGSFTDTAATANATVYYQVVAVNANGSSTGASATAVTAAPAQPTTTVVKAAPNNNGTYLTWNDSGGLAESNVIIERFAPGTSTSPTQVGVVSAGVNGFFDTIANASTYSYKVYSTNAIGGNDSLVQRISPYAAPPAAPSGIFAAAFGVGGAIAWDDLHPGATSQAFASTYTVTRSDDGGSTWQSFAGSVFTVPSFAADAHTFYNSYDFMLDPTPLAAGTHIYKLVETNLFGSSAPILASFLK